MWCWHEAMIVPVSRGFLLAAVALTAIAGCTVHSSRSGTDAIFFGGLSNSEFEDADQYRNYRGDPNWLIGVLESKGATCGTGVAVSSNKKRQNAQCYYVYCVNGRLDGNQWTVDSKTGALSSLYLSGLPSDRPAELACKDENLLALQRKLADGELTGEIRQTRPMFKGDRSSQFLSVQGEKANGAQ
jgi:hypothetical protein